MKKVITLLALLLCVTSCQALFTVVTSEYTRAEADTILSSVVDGSNTWGGVTGKVSYTEFELTNAATAVLISTNAADIATNTDTLTSYTAVSNAALGAVQDSEPNVNVVQIGDPDLNLYVDSDSNEIELTAVSGSVRIESLDNVISGSPVSVVNATDPAHALNQNTADDIYLQLDGTNEIYDAIADAEPGNYTAVSNAALGAVQSTNTTDTTIVTTGSTDITISASGNGDVDILAVDGELNLFGHDVIRLTSSGGVEITNGTLFVSGDPTSSTGVGNQLYNDTRYSGISLTNNVADLEARTNEWDTIDFSGSVNTTNRTATLSYNFTNNYWTTEVVDD